MKRKIDLPTGFYIAGLVDGEGCFFITSARAKGNLACGFAVKLRSDDRPLLEWLCAITGVGRVIDDPPHKFNPTSRWLVHRKADVCVIRDLFLKHPLQSKKKRDFAIWAEAVDYWEHFVANGPWAQVDWTPMAEAKARLTEVRRYPEAEAA